MDETKSEEKKSDPISSEIDNKPLLDSLVELMQLEEGKPLFQGFG